MQLCYSRATGRWLQCAGRWLAASLPLAGALPRLPGMRTRAFFRHRAKATVAGRLFSASAKKANDCIMTAAKMEFFCAPKFSQHGPEQKSKHAPPHAWFIPQKCTFHNWMAPAGARALLKIDASDGGPQLSSTKSPWHDIVKQVKLPVEASLAWTWPPSVQKKESLNFGPARARFQFEGPSARGVRAQVAA